MSSIFDLLLSSFIGTPTLLSPPPVEEIMYEEPLQFESIEFTPEEGEFLEFMDIEPIELEEFDLPDFQENELSEEQLELEQTEFLNSFSEAVLDKDKNETMQHIDWLYKEEQLDNILQGNQEQFLNELFCGQITIVDQFHCIPFQEVTDIKAYKKTLLNKFEFYPTQIDFLIEQGGTKIYQSMDLYRDSFNPKLYGLYGSEG